VAPAPRAALDHIPAVMAVGETERPPTASRGQPNTKIEGCHQAYAATSYPKKGPIEGKNGGRKRRTF